MVEREASIEGKYMYFLQSSFRRKIPKKKPSSKLKNLYRKIIEKVSWTEGKYTYFQKYNREVQYRRVSKVLALVILEIC